MIEKAFENSQSLEQFGRAIGEFMEGMMELMSRKPELPREMLESFDPERANQQMLE
jgi:hypothetical protein